ncbi:CpsD/CapB family tyrosine-protein kinase [Paenibacillus sedimenti]|uniref:non-specific protein-tyrosine kinase n=1 Tax=Paenibacillus sedimenti TaxID=2770274 RepID=A0A926QHR0_9BACL|nr:CpsD/CapB family tyrosine-protein kinase [Paenibacillus sedimenti]MBD0379765.1 CpsD/CapB family tyrosine-protein kinase [Paenibacillus sedimenti]
MAQKTIKLPIMIDVSPRSRISDAYRTLRTNIELYDEPDNLKVISVISSYPGEGKTTTAVNLAVAFAQANQKVLIIDAAFRNPSLQDIFLVHNQTGLSEILSARDEIEDPVQSTHIPNLFVLTAGLAPDNPSDLLSNHTFSSIINTYREVYNKIIIDTSPMFAMSESMLVAAKSDGVLLVIEHGRVKAEVLANLKTTFDRLNIQIVSVAINKMNKKYIS